MAVPIVAGGVVLGNLLNQFFSDAQQTIERARREGQYLAMEAGIQLRQTVESARIAYADSLTLTMDRVDATIQRTMGQLQTVVQGALAQQAAMQTNLAAQVQQIANTLPFRNEDPQLTSVRPRYVLRMDDSDVVFRFQGNFLHVQRQGYEPTLRFLGVEHAATQTTTQQLEFRIPPSRIFDPATTSGARIITFTEGTLKIPYPSGRIISSRAEANFTITIGALPGIPGSISLSFRITRRVRTERTRDFPVNLHSDDRHTHKDVEFTATPAPGYKIDINTAQITRGSKWGAYSGPDWVIKDESRLVCRATTEWNEAFGIKMKPGMIDCSMTFREWREDDIPETVTETVNLRWGDTRAFIPGSDHKTGSDGQSWRTDSQGWKISFDAFDSSHNDFVGTDTTSSPYLRVEAQGNGFIIKAVRPSELDRV